MKRVFAMKHVIALLSVFSLVACLDATGPGPSDPASETFASSLGVGDLSDKTVWKQTINGTYYRDDVVGSGAALVVVDPTDSVFVDYTGWLKDGTQFGTQTGLGFQAGGVIIGFIDGMTDMRVGGTRLVVVPSALAYGNTRRDIIPPNSTLIFRIKLNAFR